MRILPGWDSLSSVTKIHSTLEVAGIICLFLLGVTEIFAFVYNHRKDELIHAADLAATERRNQEATEAQQQHEAQLTHLQERLATTSASAEELTKRTQESEQKLSDIQKQQTPRSLTQMQRDFLVAVLKPFPSQKYSIYCILGDTEGKGFADDFVEVFKAVGWDGGNASGVAQGVFTVNPTGIEVHVSDKQAATVAQVPLAATTLVLALVQLGLIPSKDIYRDPQVEIGSVRINVGKKPIP